MKFLARICCFLFLFATLFLAMGCAHRETCLTKTPCEHLPEDLFTPIPGSLKGMASGEISMMGKRIPIHLFILVKQPASMRVELLSLIGPPDLILTVKNGEARFYLPLRGEFYMTKRPSMPRLIGFPITVEDLVAYLTGRLPGYFRAYCVKEEITEERVRYDVLTNENETYMTIWKDGKDKHPRGIIRYDEERHPLYVVSFSDFRSLGSYVLPYTIAISDRKGRSFRLNYEELELIHDDINEAFDVSAPPGMNLIELEDENLPFLP